MPSQVFGTDRVWLYNVKPWSELGFGVPNFGKTVGTLSIPIANLVDEIGYLQLAIMTSTDAMRRQPPSRNVAQKLAKTINRIRSVLEGRRKSENELLTDELHSKPAPQAWNIHPVPYFNSSYCVNHWLREYNELVMIALCNAMQHSDNNLSMTITDRFARDIWQYFRDIKLLLGTELFLLPRAEVEKDEFVFTDAHFAKYSPSTEIVFNEGLGGPGDIFGIPTEEDLALLAKGIPAPMIIPNLAQYAIGPIPGRTGISGIPSESAAAPGTTDGKAVGPAPLGDPQI